jgi:ferredoxin--NADP+ reductase
VVLVHGVRHARELAYDDFIRNELPDNELFGDLVRERLIYYPTVTREPYHNQGRITQLIESGRLFSDIGLPTLDPARDRVMICGSVAMLRDCCALLDQRKFAISLHTGVPGDYVVERAFVDS